MNDIIIIITICLFLSPTVPAEGLKIWGAHGKRRSFEGIGLLFLFLPNIGFAIAAPNSPACPHDQFFPRPGKSFLTTGF